MPKLRVRKAPARTKTAVRSRRISQAQPEPGVREKPKARPRGRSSATPVRAEPIFQDLEPRTGPDRSPHQCESENICYDCEGPLRNDSGGWYERLEDRGMRARAVPICLECKRKGKGLSHATT